MRKSIKSLHDALLEPEKRYRPSLDESVEWYKYFNKSIFDSTLPKNPVYDFIFEVVPLKNAFGSTAFYHDENRMLELQLHEVFPRKRVFLEVLAHEMVHLYQIVMDGKHDHGASFWAWKPILAKHHLGLQTKYYKLKWRKLFPQKLN